MVAQTLLQSSSTAESLSADETNKGEHECQLNPCDPRETGQRPAAGVVRVAIVVDRRGDRTCSGQHEEPCEEDPDTVSGDRSEHTANAGQEEGKVRDAKEEGPPSDKDEEAYGAGCLIAGRVVFAVEVGRKRGCDDGNDEGPEGQEGEDDRMSSTDGSTTVYHF